MTNLYQGTELELFARATNWKSYVARRLAPYIRGRVLEVGAGIGANTSSLANPLVTEWVALEPDPRLAAEIGNHWPDTRPLLQREVVTGTIDTLSDTARFDTILYMDVLEHIEDDRGQAAHAARLLNPGGHLVVLAPAHQYLFSPFDTAVGHFRRYNLKQLRALTPPGCHIELCQLMDSVGLLASLANRMMLRRTIPTARQIMFWDGFMVRASRVLDTITGYRIGKSALMVWRAEPEGAAA
jgi:SAM-dependent methyltransferase